MLENYPDILNLNDIMKILNVGRNATLNLLQSSQIKSFRVGKKYRVLKKNLIEFMEK